MKVFGPKWMITPTRDLATPPVGGRFDLGETLAKHLNEDEQDKDQQNEAQQPRPLQAFH
jgi:hypothetical protein